MISVSAGSVSSFVPANGGPPPNGYGFITGKAADNSRYLILFKAADGSRTPLVGKGI